MNMNKKNKKVLEVQNEKLQKITQNYSIDENKKKNEINKLKKDNGSMKQIL